jgi:glutaryl-CoA dehydrogenase
VIHYVLPYDSFFVPEDLLMPFRGIDFYRIDELLSDEERLVRDTVRRFVDERVMPIIDKHFEDATFPKELIPEMAELGLFGGNLPEEYGCAGMNNVAYGLVMQELERADSGLRSFVSVQGALVMYPILEFGSEEQKRKWIPALAKGEKIGCFGLTEPDHGSDPGGMETRAEHTSKGWVLNGTKRWITNGTIADIAIVWAKVADEIKGFMVETASPGFQAPEIKNKLSLRASVTSDLILDDVVVPEAGLLPLASGLKAPLMCLNQARYGIAWGGIGAAMACYECALEYTKGRTQFEKPIAQFQLVQEKLAHMLTEITKGQLLAWRLGRLKDEGRLHFAQTSMAKRNNVSVALDAARVARDLLGASGITLEYPVFRHLCNLESVYTYEGTDHIHALILGEYITGLPAYK